MEQQQQQQQQGSSISRIFRKMSLDASRPLSVFHGKHEKQSSESSQTCLIQMTDAPMAQQVHKSVETVEPYPETRCVVEKIHELEETITKMRLHNERLSLDLTRLQQQLITASSQKMHSDHLRVTVTALQTQIGVLLDELNLAWEGRYDRMSLQSILEFSLTRRPNTANDEKWRNFQKQFMQKLQQIIYDAEVRISDKNMSSKPSHSRNASTQTLVNEAPKQEYTVKRIPKRIANRPPGIRIPMVRIQNARLQEIELLRHLPAHKVNVAQQQVGQQQVLPRASPRQRESRLML